MAKIDSTFVKRTAPKKRNGIQVPAQIKEIGSDIAAGVGELKRQTGAAVENVKSGYRKIRQAIKP